MKSAVKVRIYPTDEQQIALAKAFGCARWFWNNSLAMTNQLYKDEVARYLRRIPLNLEAPSNLRWGSSLN